MGRLSLLLLLAAAILAACAETRLPANPVVEESPAPESDATKQGSLDEFFSVVEGCNEILLHAPYFEAFVEKVVSAVSLDIEPPYDETAVLKVSLGPVGFVEDLELASVSSPTIKAPFELLVTAPPSFPRAPREVRKCLGARPFPLVVKVFEIFQCRAQEEYLAYNQSIELRLYKTLYSPHYSGSPGRGWVRLGVSLGSEGQVRNLAFRGRPNPLARAKLRAVIAAMREFPPPPDFSRCFAEKPLELRMEVQGE